MKSIGEYMWDYWKGVNAMRKREEVAVQLRDLQERVADLERMNNELREFLSLDKDKTSLMAELGNTLLPSRFKVEADAKAKATVSRKVVQKVGAKVTSASAAVEKKNGRGRPLPFGAGELAKVTLKKTTAAPVAVPSSAHVVTSAKLVSMRKKLAKRDLPVTTYTGKKRKAREVEREGGGGGFLERAIKEKFKNVRGGIEEGGVEEEQWVGGEGVDDDEWLNEDEGGEGGGGVKKTLKPSPRKRIRTSRRRLAVASSKSIGKPMRV
ncbi:hypothetical protein TrCOL_g3070 [Triparma columacea]|uniref:Uncharacterized protein n=1 Tax=Triparma columacea TaxID=722753 RepID=A0A9W7LEA5_9STRA|nr:hypothetical protein TrCOL_g3070 [Triparma columacea]